MNDGVVAGTGIISTATVDMNIDVVAIFALTADTAFNTTTTMAIVVIAYQPSGGSVFNISS